MIISVVAVVIITAVIVTTIIINIISAINIFFVNGGCNLATKFFMILAINSTVHCS